MPDPQAPTEEQIKQVVDAANAKESQLWQGDFDDSDLTIPYKRTDEENNEEDKSDKDTKPADNEDSKAVEEQVEQYAEPTQVVTASDPGDYQPEDYSFEIEIDGTSYTVSNADEAEKLADDHAEDLTAKQVMQLITKASRMELKSERDKEAWQTKKNQYDAQVTEEETRVETVQNLAAGFEYLESKGLLPKLTPEEQTTAWNELDLKEHPNVKLHMDIIDYMEQENEARAKAKVPLLTSALDAYNAYELENRNKQVDERKVTAGVQRKAAGARVASPSTNNQGPYVPKGISLGRSDLMRRGSTDEWAAVLDNQQ